MSVKSYIFMVSLMMFVMIGGVCLALIFFIEINQQNNALETVCFANSMDLTYYGSGFITAEPFCVNQTHSCRALQSNGIGYLRDCKKNIIGE